MMLTEESPLQCLQVGTDIIDAKCSWLLVHALRAASADQRIQLVNNIGRGESGECDDQSEGALEYLSGLIEAF